MATGRLPYPFSKSKAAVPVIARTRGWRCDRYGHRYFVTESTIVANYLATAGSLIAKLHKDEFRKRTQPRVLIQMNYSAQTP